MMSEPTVWMQLGVSEERFATVTSKEIESILRTKETIGNMILMVQSSTKLTENERLYAAFHIAKYDIARKLAGKLPSFAKGILLGVTED